MTIAHVLFVLAIAACGYVFGMLGSLLGALRDLRQVTERDGARLFIFILLAEIAVYPPVQLFKISVDLVTASLLASHGFFHAAACTSGICFLAGFGFMRLLPLRK